VRIDIRLLLSNFLITPTKVSRTVDASFCYLLLTLEKLWTVSSVDVRQNLIGKNFFQLMTGILGPLSGFLVQQPIPPTSNEVAGPCFGYYQVRATRLHLRSSNCSKKYSRPSTAYGGNASAVAQLQSVQHTVSMGW
jgi:hypothetical protein